MRKVYKLEDLDCANCAAKMQAAIAKIDGVNEVSVNYMTQKLTLDADDARFEEILKLAQKAMNKVEPDCRIIR
ncbi:MAG: cation transporter [Christensenellaceae bacterium]|nr:cation transporter [Christensenellaceae bacterium]